MPFCTPVYSTGSASTITYWPQTWTTSVTATNVTTLDGLWQPVTQWTTTAGNVLEPGWQWGWHPQSRAELDRTLLETYQPPSRAELDRMQRAEHRRRAEWRAESERQARDRARITERAEALLLSLLDEIQAASYIQQGWFEVRGSAGGRYRVNRRGQAGNVDEMDGNVIIASLCIHPYGGFPDADAHVAQYLALVTDEPGFRRTANRTPHIRRPAGMAA
jgi:hypothetical protein